MKSNFSKVLTSAILLVCFAAPVLALSDAAEIAIGRQADVKLRAKYGVFENASVQKYIERTALKLINVSGRQDLVYHVAVLDTNHMNAMAVLGGYLYITKGMLCRLGNEAQLAAVLAVEIAHIARRHGVEQLNRQVKGLKKILAEQIGSETALDFAYFGYDKKLQTDADLKAVEYLINAGYAPQAAIDALDIVQIKEIKDPKLVASYVRSHYKTTKRIDAVRRMSNALRQQDSARYDSLTGSYYQEDYKEKISDVISGAR